jgi:hypothetical protein
VVIIAPSNIMVAGTLVKVEKGSCEVAPLPLDNKTCKRTYICCNDPRLNYVFTTKQLADDDPSLPVVIERDRFDYGVVIKKGEEETEDNVGTLDEVVPLSYAQIKKPEQGEEWYRNKYPNLPEDFYGIIARYTWGHKFTKKEIKNEKKKYERKKGKKEPPVGLSILKGKHTISFD